MKNITRITVRLVVAEENTFSMTLESNDVPLEEWQMDRFLSEVKAFAMGRINVLDSQAAKKAAGK